MRLKSAKFCSSSKSCHFVKQRFILNYTFTTERSNNILNNVISENTAKKIFLPGHSCHYLEIVFRLNDQDGKTIKSLFTKKINGHADVSYRKVMISATSLAVFFFYKRGNILQINENFLGRIFENLIVTNEALLPYILILCYIYF